MGRERVPGRERRTPHVTPATTPKTSPVRREYEAGPSRLPAIRRAVPPKIPRTGDKPLTRKTTELAKMMNADVVVAEPVGDGPISNIVIPPGIVNEDRTTIVNISQPVADIESRATSQVANRSIQVISETLDEQDAAEAAVVQSRLNELQQARRDFVIAVANVGGNAVNLDDETPPDLFLESPPGSPFQYHPSPPPRQLIRVPDIQDEMLQPEYGRDHPDIVAAREFMLKAKAEREARLAAKRMEEEFAEIAGHIRDPLEDDYLWPEEEEEEPPYQYEPFDPDELERFFDTQAYPPCPRCHGPPAGREQLHPDLWELEDPWFREASPPDIPDLIQFD